MMNRAAAEMLAARALGWMAGQEDLMLSFLAASGAGLDDLRARAADPDFLGFLLDFLLADEAALLAFCAAEGVHPETPARARAALPGGDVPDWT